MALNDSKGVLNKSNNSKWVKNAENSKYTVLPSVTMIEEGKGVSGCDYKKIIKPDGTKGEGVIESIVLSGEDCDYMYEFSDFESVRASVSAWLSSHNQYKSAMDVVQSKNSDDIASLLSLYSITPKVVDEGLI